MKNKILLNNFSENSLNKFLEEYLKLCLKHKIIIYPSEYAGIDYFNNREHMISFFGEILMNISKFTGFHVNVNLDTKKPKAKKCKIMKVRNAYAVIGNETFKIQTSKFNYEHNKTN